jgi:hypothetical protein
MIPLDSPRWSELQHAYGSAADIPALLRELETFPSSEGNGDPWFTLWSSLCHQESIYSASFAAVPHIVRILASDPMRAEFCFFQLPACIEFLRLENEITIPVDLQQAYREAVQQLPSLVAAAADRSWDESLLCCALSAIAAAKGFPSIARAAMELYDK